MLNLNPKLRSHDVAVGAERMNSSSLLAANAKGTAIGLEKLFTTRMWYVA